MCCYRFDDGRTVAIVQRGPPYPQSLAAVAKWQTRRAWLPDSAGSTPVSRIQLGLEIGIL